MDLPAVDLTLFLASKFYKIQSVIKLIDAKIKIKIKIIGIN